MVYLQTKKPDLGKFWRVLQWKIWVYLMEIWSTYFTANLVYFVVIWYMCFLVLVSCTNKNLAALLLSRKRHCIVSGLQGSDYIRSSEPRRADNQGRQMAAFETKNPDLGKFLRAFDWKKLIYFMHIWNILWIFGKVYDHLVHFVLILIHVFRFRYHVPRKIWQPR
jgi:hypothetical protein